MNKSISRKFIAVLLSFVMTTGMAVAASVPVFAEEAVPSVTTTWANEDYPVIQNENGEYIAVNSEGKPVKYNGLQIKTTTTENTDGTRVEETVRYTFKNGKCTQVKESRTTTLEQVSPLQPPPTRTPPRFPRKSPTPIPNTASRRMAIPSRSSPKKATPSSTTAS